MVPKRLLLVAALGNFVVALLHFALAFAGEATNRYFGAPPGVLRLYRQERPLFVLLVLGMAALVGLVYMFRGLELPADIVVAMRRPEFGRQFIVFSAVSLDRPRGIKRRRGDKVAWRAWLWSWMGYCRSLGARNLARGARCVALL
jgi:hypothetical protein